MKPKKLLLLSTLSLGIAPIATIAAGCTTKTQEGSKNPTATNDDSKIDRLTKETEKIKIELDQITIQLKNLTKLTEELKNNQTKTENSTLETKKLANKLEDSKLDKSEFNKIEEKLNNLSQSKVDDSKIKIIETKLEKLINQKLESKNSDPNTQINKLTEKADDFLKKLEEIKKENFSGEKNDNKQLNDIKNFVEELKNFFKDETQKSELENKLKQIEEQLKNIKDKNDEFLKIRKKQDDFYKEFEKIKQLVISIQGKNEDKTFLNNSLLPILGKLPELLLDPTNVDISKTNTIIKELENILEYLVNAGKLNELLNNSELKTILENVENTLKSSIDQNDLTNLQNKLNDFKEKVGAIILNELEKFLETNSNQSDNVVDFNKELQNNITELNNELENVKKNVKKREILAKIEQLKNEIDKNLSDQTKINELAEETKKLKELSQ
ncbi:coiled-coil domain-containing protein [Mycoplasmopsis cricetuli]|uniref:hypothetical protein n=1 Tax=Mycoplasmopsis cricetuli TaxID=171283 RepID=UPI000470501F|nr:hypothetical protein [Mycoplasmopsis cricetuli]